jgi:hypothetical protein
VVTWGVVGAVALLALELVLGVLGAVLGAAFPLLRFLVFTVAPLALAGWGVMKVFERLPRPEAPADDLAPRG